MACCWASAVMNLDVLVVLVGMLCSSFLWFASPARSARARHRFEWLGSTGGCCWFIAVSAGAVVEAGGNRLRVWVAVVTIPPATASVAAEAALPSSSGCRPLVRLRLSLFVKL